MAAEELDKMTVITELSNQGKSKSREAAFYYSVSSYFQLFSDGCLLLRSTLLKYAKKKMLQEAASLETQVSL